ncbi:MAG: hypothetical protein ACTSPG_03165 [Candidatus Hodarchaeales archaeon]
MLIYFDFISLDQKFVPLATATILQLWVILLTARSTSVQFFVRMDKAGLISLISVYIMVTLGLILGF